MTLVFIPIRSASDPDPRHLPAVDTMIEEIRQGQLELYARTGAAEPWIGYFAREAATGGVLGSCSFVGPPADGAVEIAYFTFPPAEGRGVAGQMAAELVRRAAATGTATAVIAHTLREENASTAILKRLGFTVAGEVIDDEAGIVWRWRLPLGDQA